MKTKTTFLVEDSEDGGKSWSILGKSTSRIVAVRMAVWNHRQYFKIASLCAWRVSKVASTVVKVLGNVKRKHE